MKIRFFNLWMVSLFLSVASAHANDNQVTLRGESFGSIASLDLSGPVARELFAAMSSAEVKSTVLNGDTYTTRTGRPRGVFCVQYISANQAVTEYNCSVGFKDLKTGEVDDSANPSDPFQP